MNGKLLKNIGIYAAIAAVFVILSYAFVPEVLEGKIVDQSDISGWRGMAQETLDWNAAHPDDKTAWSGSMFCGMPNVTSIDSFSGDWTKPLYQALLWGRRPASYILIALLGAFLMMLSMGIDRFLSAVGAVAVAFCSYNFQIIQVGHNTKMQAIAFAPWAIAALVFTYRMALRRRSGNVGWKQWLPQTLLGAVFFALALSFQIKANHVQITYYLAIIIFIYAISTLVWVICRKDRELLARFFSASALLLVLGLVGIGTNANKLIPTAAYAPYTMRGGSELSGEGTNGKGLSLDYATAWSYGIDETPNLMIPNYNGGSSSGSLTEKSATWQLFRKAGQNPSAICKALPLYWGPQPFTAGPMYIGAISIFLFILGLCLLSGREKWWLLVCCILAVLLAWGSHFIWFTELWFKYVPMYNKFRTVSMALVILQFCVPLLGIYTLDQIMKDNIAHRQVVKGVYTSLAVTAGFCALTALIPSIAGDFKAAGDAGMQDILAKALQQDRRHLLQTDAWRSFLLIVASAGVIVWSYLKEDSRVHSKRMRYAVAIIAVLMVVDMWSVGKRYLGSDDFITPRNFSSRFDEREADRVILQDKGQSFRVLDLSENTFNSSLTSFRHKSIGGYSPTKMQRYQDLIDHYLMGEINSFYKEVSQAKTLAEMQEAVPYMPVMSMLNDRYIIVGAEYPPLVNPYSYGNAWFVGGTVSAVNADEEIAMLGQVDLRHRAVVRTEDAGNLQMPGCEKGSGNDGYSGGEDGSDKEEYTDGEIVLTSYSPNEMHYSYTSDKAAVAVFSEIFHPSWKATLNGSDLDLFRADWVLRAAVLPAGEGEIVMRYEPEDYVIGETISRICSILLVLLAAAVVATALFLPRHCQGADSCVESR